MITLSSIHAECLSRAATVLSFIGVAESVKVSIWYARVSTPKGVFLYGGCAANDHWTRDSRDRLDDWQVFCDSIVGGMADGYICDGDLTSWGESVLKGWRNVKPLDPAEEAAWLESWVPENQLQAVLNVVEGTVLEALADDHV